MWQPGHPNCYTFASSFSSSYSCAAVRFGQSKAMDTHAHLTNVVCPNKLQMVISKAPVKRTRRKSTKLKASLRNRNLLTNFTGSVAERICKSVVEFTQVAKSRNFLFLFCFAYMRMTRDRPVLTCVGWPNGRKLCQPVCEF